jgi:class 3 adenylate cyclase
MAAGKAPEEIASTDFSDELNVLAERSVLAMYHAQQSHAWTANIVGGFEAMMARAGLYSRLDRPPAVCFLDITGYTRLTQERGDEAAANLAGTLARLVQRSSQPHGGRAIKWLGDGVMFHFRDPGPGVQAALEMRDGQRPPLVRNGRVAASVAAAGLEQQPSLPPLRVREHRHQPLRVIEARDLGDGP